MNLALSHPHQPHAAQSTRESSRPARRAARKQRAFLRQACSRPRYLAPAPAAFSIVALSLAAGNSFPVAAEAAGSTKAPLLTALQSKTPRTQISQSAPVALSETNATGATRVASSRSTRATALEGKTEEVPATVAALNAWMRNAPPTASAKPIRSGAKAAIAQRAKLNGAAHKPAKLVVPVSSSKGKTTIRTAKGNQSVRVINGGQANSNNRLARSDEATVSALPAATMKPREIAPSEADGLTSLPDMGESSKVIKVDALKLPPVSQPLPAWMQNVTVSVDQLTPIPPKAKPGTRVAQNPSAPPLRQPQSPVTSSDRLPNQIEVATSTYVVLVTRVDLETVAIADPNIADVTIVNARSVLVNGKSAGATTLVIVDRLGKIRQYQVRVVPAPGAREVDIARIIGIEGVGVRRVQDAIILEGEVSSAEELKRAIDIAGIFSPKIVNQLRVRGAVEPGAATALQIQEAIGRPEVTVRVSGEKAILDGVVANEMERMRAEMIAKTYVTEVINTLRLPTITVEQVRDLLGGVETPNRATSVSDIAGELLPPPSLVVRRVGDQVILEGVLPTQADIDAAVAAAARTGLQVTNRLSVAPLPSTHAVLLQTVAQAIGIPGVRVRGTAKRLVLEGTVADTNTALRAGQVARGFATDVDNMLAVTNPTQVNVDVSIVEISKTDFKNLGLSFPGLTDSSTGFTGGSALGGIGGGIGIGEGAGGTNLGTSFETRLRAQIDDGRVRLLSNPRTTVLSGRTASFQAGGQIPIPTNAQVTGTGITTVQIEFKDFGVLMDVSPVATNEGIVTMRVRTDITQLDPEIGTIEVAPDISVPSFTRRAAVTEVTTRSGGTIALSGLISNNVRRAVRSVPFLSKIPIIGSLFTSKRFLRGETDLVIFVTPRVLPNVLPAGVTAPSGVIAEGPSTLSTVVLGNPGLTTFGTIGGAGVQPAGGGGGAASGGG